MVDSWTAAQELFNAWPDLSKIRPGGGVLRRLVDALRDLDSRAAAPLDVAVLTRQVLLDAAVRGNRAGLEVPVERNLPTESDWAVAGCFVGRGPRGFHVAARPWHVPVTGEAAVQDAELDMINVHLGAEAEQLYTPRAYPADPFWQTALGFDSYKSIGQRQAARAVALASPGSTLIICLPTGHGKTAVFQAPSALSRRRAGLTLVVVPTVVLALDMERRTRELLDAHGLRNSSGRYAYTGEMSDEEKRAIREDVVAGSQRFLFTSPEALITGLSHAVGEAAAAGLLKYFVIDEAHLVEQWGNRFRQSFQTMATYRRVWLRDAPPGRRPVTVAMSATLTSQQVRTLRDLFGDAERIPLVSAAQLRHEPSYYTQRFSSEVERASAVLEAVTMLPKPLALYASTRDAADKWFSLLRERGFRRVAKVTGDSSDTERQTVVEGWGGKTSTGPVPTTCDVVVGTSAFGLGVDLPDVRSVVHACVPETVDRYYQEVGRGGRDGNPSLAVVLSTNRDADIAHRIGYESIITPELAWKRWKSMFDGRMTTGEETYRVDLDRYQDTLVRSSDQSRSWNTHILNIMNRARLVDLHLPQPPSPDGSDDRPQELRDFYDSAASHVDISLVDSDANNEGEFLRRFASVREDILAGQREAVGNLNVALRGSGCISDTLSRYYTVDGVRVGANCRGCNWCRRYGERKRQGFYRLADEPNPLVPYSGRQDKDPLARHRSGQSCLSLWWADDEERDVLVPQLLVALAKRGMTVLGGPGVTDALAADLQHEATGVAIVRDGDNDLLNSFAGPLIWLADRRNERFPKSLVSRFQSPDVVYVIHPRDAGHPERHEVPFRTLHRASFSVRRAWKAL